MKNLKTENRCCLFRIVVASSTPFTSSLRHFTTTMKYSHSIQLVCIVVVFLLSLVGFAIPFQLASRSKGSQGGIVDNAMYAILKSFSTGVILGVAVLHLAVDSIEDLSAYSEYPSKMRS